MTIDGSEIDNESWAGSDLYLLYPEVPPPAQKEARGQMERMQPRPGNLGQESG